MLSFFESNSRLGRRDFLRVGSLGLGGLSLPSFLAAKSQAASLVKDRSVIFLFLHGGPSQVETFDPKMTAPTGVCSVTGEIDTTLPGITYGSTFTRLAKLAHKTNVVRSYRSGDASHDIKPIVSKVSQGANIGSLYSRIVGANHPTTGMPRNAVIFPRAVDDSTQPGNEKFGKFGSTGTLGEGFAPFIPGSGGSLQSDMQLRLSREHLDDRRNLLGSLDKIKREMDEGKLEGVDRFREQAFSTIVGGVAEAFDLKHEDPRTIERYNTAPLMRPEQISRKWNNYKNYVDNGKSLGKLLLLARRLCERGCGFVTVTTNFVWDMHADVNNATIDEGMQYMGLPLDYAVSAFIEDCEARGLSDKILLVVTGEMGRTPKVNKNGGRDHWGNLTPLMLYGGGLNKGQVIGQSTADAGEPLTEAQDTGNLIATIMHSLVDMGQVRLQSGLPQDLLRTISTPAPIPGLM